MKIAAGSPRWAVVCAWLALASVVPSGVWRVLVGIGVPLGWSDAQLEAQAIPGSGTAYVIVLTVVSVLAAGATLLLVYDFGKRIPKFVVVPGVIVGVGAIAAVCTLSIVNWDSVNGFADNPDSAWRFLMIACYVPALAWAPLLCATTFGYVKRPSSVKNIE